MTVNVVDPLIAPDVAVMSVVPAATLVARPLAAIVAVAGVPDVHVTLAVRFWVLPFVYVPVAVNCCVCPATIEGEAGVTAIDTNDGAVTVNVVDPLITPDVAVMSVVPATRLVASPLAAIVAVAGVPDVHVTLAVRFWVLPFE